MASTHLLGVWDVTGIGQNKSAKLVKILHCPPPLELRAETLKHIYVTETCASLNVHIAALR